MEMVEQTEQKEISEGFNTQLTTEWNCLSYYWIREPKKHTKVLVTSDSKYVVDSVEKGWV
jgi:ribonuclease HI